jgi:hypothetical protein
MFECSNLLDPMYREEFENFMSNFHWTSVFVRWGNYARVSGNALVVVEKNNFWLIWTYLPGRDSSIGCAAISPALLALPLSPPPHSSDAHYHFFSRALSVCVCARLCCLVLFGVVIRVRCSFSCFGCGREKCSWILFMVSTWSLCIAALSVRNRIQILWRRRSINDGSGSGGRLLRALLKILRYRG